jgi:glutathione peroxidase
MSTKVQNSKQVKSSIYDFEIEDINGKLFSFEACKGKKLMIVNTASRCGLTPQYALLEDLYEKYKSSNFMIVGFPSNNFLMQEPGSNEKIAAFCQKNYGVSFPMMSKISVRGRQQHPLYKFLTSKKLNGVISSRVKWNFQKYLINEEGILEKVISPQTKPNHRKIIDWIEGAN